MARPLLFQAPHEPIANPQTGIISRPWYLWFLQLIQEFTTAGDVFGPGSSTDNAIARWDGASGTQLKNSVVTIANDGTFAFPDGIRQTFNPNGTNSGLNVGAQSGDPSSLVNGDIWYDSTANTLDARINGATVSLTGDGTGVATSVLGRAANSTGARADIQATANGQILIRLSDTLGFALLQSVGYWSPITNGSASNPELIFDSNGDIVVGWVAL